MQGNKGCGLSQSVGPQQSCNAFLGGKGGFGLHSLYVFAHFDRVFNPFSLVYGI